MMDLSRPRESDSAAQELAAESYPNMDLLARVVGILSGLALPFSILGMLAVASDGGEVSWAPLGIVTAGLIFSYFALLGIHVARDVRTTRILSTRIRELLEWPRSADGDEGKIEEPQA